MAQDKKPVWADQEAHGILKRWASLQKRHMVDVASELLLEKLPLLEGGEAASAAAASAPSEPKKAASAPSAPEAAAKAPAPAATKEKAVDAPAKAAAGEAAEDVAPSQETADSPSRTEVRTVDKPTSGVRPMTDKETTFLGGVWLV